jgi:hypothetical protein
MRQLPTYGNVALLRMIVNPSFDGRRSWLSRLLHRPARANACPMAVLALDRALTVAWDAVIAPGVRAIGLKPHCLSERALGALRLSHRHPCLSTGAMRSAHRRSRAHASLAATSAASESPALACFPAAATRQLKPAATCRLYLRAPTAQPECLHRLRLAPPIECLVFRGRTKSSNGKNGAIRSVPSERERPLP